MIYIGFFQWLYLKWVCFGIISFEEYVCYFNCVEGNIILYVLLKLEIVVCWYEQIYDDFCFCFKFLVIILYQVVLCYCDELSSEFFVCLVLLVLCIGQYWLQLLVMFGFCDFFVLWYFFDGLLKDFIYGVEVCYFEFFVKGEVEQQFNCGLYECNVNCVIFDSCLVYSVVVISLVMIDV